MKWLAHQRLGYNYRLSDINCALGLAQLARIKELLTKRHKVATIYAAAFKGIDEIIIPPPNQADIKRSWFVYVIILRKGFSAAQRDRIIKRLRQEGIGCNVYFPPIHLQVFYRKLGGYQRGDFPVTESISERTIALPFYNNLKQDQISRVVKLLKTAIKEVQKGTSIFKVKLF